jgi:hypothetical protein
MRAPMPRLEEITGIREKKIKSARQYVIDGMPIAIID